MEKSLPVSENKRHWQIGLYTVSALFAAWDLFLTNGSLIAGDFFSYDAFFLLLILLLLSISCLLAAKWPRLGARSAFVASAIGLLFYLSVGFINFAEYPYHFFDITRFSSPRIFSFGSTLIYSQRILQSPIQQAESLIPIFLFKLHWTPKKQKYLVTVFSVVAVVLIAQWLYPRASCIISGGKWVRDGIFGQAQYCLYSYSDAGKACQSSMDCMGACIIDDYSLNIIVVPTAGICAPDNRGFGCINYFEHREIYSVCTD